MIQIKLLHSKDEYLSVPLVRGQANPLKTVVADKRLVCFVCIP